MNEHKNIITIEDEIKEFSDKPVKSSALYKKAKELESNAVPDASEASVGDVLSLDEDKKPTWAAPSEELPSVTGNTGKFLAVNAGGTGVEWKNVPAELPVFASGDSGKVLKVNSGETGVEWGELPTIESVTINADYTGDVKHFKVRLWYKTESPSDLTFDQASTLLANIDKVRGRSLNVSFTGAISVSATITYLIFNSGVMTVNAVGIKNGSPNEPIDITYTWTKSTNKLAIKESKYITNELPTIVSGDAGKVLKVNAGETGVEWGAAGGTQLYTHRITLGKPSVTQNFTLTVISTDATAYNESGFISYLTNHGAINGAKALPVNANCSYLSHLTNNVKFITGVYVDSSLIYGVTHNISVSNGDIVDSQANATLNFVEDICEAI